MLGCTKHKCKKVTVFFIYLHLPTSLKGKNTTYFKGLYWQKLSKNKIKQHIQKERAAKNTQNDIEQWILTATQCFMIDIKTDFIPLIIVFLYAFWHSEKVKSLTGFKPLKLLTILPTKGNICIKLDSLVKL